MAATIITFPRWMLDAACAGLPSEVFFTHSPPDADEPAKAICSSCSVRGECLAYALANRIEFGVWAGTTPKERRRLLLDLRVVA